MERKKKSKKYDNRDNSNNAKITVIILTTMVTTVIKNTDDHSDKDKIFSSSITDIAILFALNIHTHTQK